MISDSESVISDGADDRDRGYIPVLFLFSSGCLLSLEGIKAPGLFPTVRLLSGGEVPRGVDPPTPSGFPPSCVRENERVQEHWTPNTATTYL